MLGVDHARFEVVDPILRTVVLLGVFELLYEASVIIANVKLLASFTLLLAAVKKELTTQYMGDVFLVEPRLHTT